jgi:hypothetical protein
MQPPMCLQYAILAAGASASPTYKHMAEAFYVRARQYIQADEMKVSCPKSDMSSMKLTKSRAIVTKYHWRIAKLGFL